MICDTIGPSVTLAEAVRAIAKIQCQKSADVYGLLFAKPGGLRRSEVPEKRPAWWRGLFFSLVAPGWTVLFVPPVLLLVPAALPGAKTPVLVLPIELAAPIAFPVVP
jgi:hypothetical protein